MASRSVLVACLVLSTAAQAAADRTAELARLLAEYEAARTAFFAQELPPQRTAAEKIAFYKSNPRWTFVPKIVALAEADPTDAAALAACKWIAEENCQMGPQWGPLYEADETAWRIIGRQQLSAADAAQLCLLACVKQTPAREAFLRDMASRTGLPGHARGFAMLALAEYLAKRCEEAEAGGFAAWPWPDDEYMKFLRTQIADDWVEYSTIADPEPFRTESTELFRRVLDEYADVPVTITAPGFRDLKTIGDGARKSLHALEHLWVGAPAPEFDARDLDGRPLRLADYRGKVVLLSFWFTGCGPCMAMVPHEQKLLERYRDQPFALIGVCRDEDPATGRQTATEHGMTWPSVDDGRPGRVTDDYSIRGWPSFYLIDVDGTIARKNGSFDEFEKNIAKLVERASAAPQP